MLRDLIVQNRSYHRFHQEIPISMDTLIAAQSIMLGLTERGFGGCILAYKARRGVLFLTRRALQPAAEWEPGTAYLTKRGDVLKQQADGCLLSLLRSVCHDGEKC